MDPKFYNLRSSSCCRQEVDQGRVLLADARSYQQQNHELIHEEIVFDHKRVWDCAGQQPNPSQSGDRFGTDRQVAYQIGQAYGGYRLGFRLMVSLKQALCREGPIEAFGRLKPCGGCHPDYAILWLDQHDQQFSVNMCFNCNEGIFYGDTQKLYAEIGSVGFDKNLKSI